MRKTVISAGITLAFALNVPAQQNPAGSTAGQRDQSGAARQGATSATQDNRGTSAGQATTQSGQPAAAGRQDAASASRNRLENQSMVGPADQKFMMNAASAGMMEVQLAEHVRNKAESADVKALAQKIYDDHTRANEELKSIATARGISLPAEVTPKHKQEMDKMMALSGAALDRQYPREMVKHHKKDISEFEKASNNMVDTSLREFAKKNLPALREHLQMAQTATGQTRSRSSENRSDSGDKTSGATSTGTAPGTDKK